MASRTISILVGREPRAFTRLVSDTVPVIDSRTVSLTTAPVGGVKYGVSASSAELASKDSRFGTIAVTRRFNAGNPAQNLTGGRSYHVSFKGTPATVLSGSLDATHTNFFTYLNNLSGNSTIYWTYYHEPEDNIQGGAFTFAQYRQAFARIAALPGARTTKVKSALCLMAWTLRSASGRNWRNYYPEGSCDILTWDYDGIDPSGGQYSKFSVNNLPQTLAAASETGLPWAIAEFGSNRDNTNDPSGTARAAWFRSETSAYAAASTPPLYVCLFEANGFPGYDLNTYETSTWRSISGY